jgi:Na+/phosphate symporter
MADLPNTKAVDVITQALDPLGHHLSLNSEKIFHFCHSIEQIEDIIKACRNTIDIFKSDSLISSKDQISCLSTSKSIELDR